MTKRSETANALIDLLSDRPVAYHPQLAKVLGGVEEAIFVSQLLYWHGKGTRRDEFIWKTAEEFEEETGLTRRNQETARRHLRDLGVLEEKKAGIPAKLHYKLMTDKLAEHIMAYLDSQTSMAESAKLDVRNAPCSDGGSRQTIPEITLESTPEESADTLFAGDGPKRKSVTSTVIPFRSSGDPITDMAVAARLKQARGIPDWAISGPEGADPYYQVLLRFCEMTARPPGELQPRTGKQWLRTYAKLAAEHEMTVDLMVRAHDVLPGDKWGKWYIENHKWTSPNNPIYMEQLVYARDQLAAGISDLQAKQQWSRAL